MCTDARGSVCKEVLTESKGVNRSKCPYIFTKVTGVHGVTFMDDYTVKLAVHGRMNAYDKYRRYGPKQDIGTDVVGRVLKGIRYAYSLHQGS